jgi:hypothetical protein
LCGATFIQAFAASAILLTTQSTCEGPSDIARDFLQARGIQSALLRNVHELLTRLGGRFTQVLTGAVGRLRESLACRSERASLDRRSRERRRDRSTGSQAGDSHGERLYLQHAVYGLLHVGSGLLGEMP